MVCWRTTTFLSPSLELWAHRRESNDGQECLLSAPKNGHSFFATQMSAFGRKASIDVKGLTSARLVGVSSGKQTEGSFKRVTEPQTTAWLEMWLRRLQAYAPKSDGGTQTTNRRLKYIVVPQEIGDKARFAPAPRLSEILE
jgi:hypothetical protein